MSTNGKRHPVPRPFLKWVGGKGQLLDKLAPAVQQAGPFKRYHEPFVGGGALFFELCRRRMLPRAYSRLSDNNDRLMVAYRGVQQDVDGVIALLKEHKARHGEDYYYAMRAEVPDGETARAARIIYLNKTCFNGLFRENSRGIFNVPVGRYKNPLICDVENLRAVSEALQRVKLDTAPFTSVLKEAKEGDLVYFDPPYHPVSKTANFTAYAKGGFGEEEQRELARTCAELGERGVKVILSNSYTSFITGLYGDVCSDAGFTVHKVAANRMVNSRADRRGPVDEALLRNF